MTDDLRYALRMVRRAPAFSAIAVLTLALGIGANTAIFTVVNAVLLKPLPYPDAERLVQLWETDRVEGGQSVVSPVNLMEWREQTTAFSAMAAYSWQSVVLTGDGEPVRVIGNRVTQDFFDVYGVGPALGRAIGAGDARRGAGPVVVLSDRIWRERFRGDPSILGRPLALNGVPTTVVGVMPRGFAAPDENSQMWLPMVLDLASIPRGSHFLFAVGRLRPDATLQSARAQLDVVAERAEKASPGTNTDLRVAVVPLHEEIVGSIEPILILLAAAVGLVLLIACTNVANLMLARSAARRQEMAIRTALGAGRLRIARLLLVETCVLAAAGGVSGVMLSSWGVDVLIALNTSAIPRAREIAADGRVLLFALGLTAVAALAFGTAPALVTSARDVHHTLKEAGRTALPSPNRRLRRVLVVAEVALAMMLLAAGGLVWKSFVRLRNVDTGFSPERVLTLIASLPQSRYPDAPAMTLAWERILEGVGRIPGVAVASATSELPISGSRTSSSFGVLGASKEDYPRTPNTDYRIVSPRYFETMGIQVLAGRGITESDSATSPKIIVVNQELARRFFPKGDAIGRRISIRNPPVEREIVGIVTSVRHGSLKDDLRPEAYVPFRQDMEPRLMLAVRGSGDAAALAAPVRGAVRQVDPDLALYSIQTMEERISRSVAPERFNTVLLALFAAVALALATIGTYGVLAYGVAQRRHELGVRAALGAQARDLILLVLAEGMLLVGTGVVLGLLGARVSTRMVSGLLFGVRPADPAVLVLVAGILVVVGLLACVVPAIRAGRVDPLTALRAE